MGGWGGGGSIQLQQKEFLSRRYIHVNLNYENAQPCSSSKFKENVEKEILKKFRTHNIQK